VSSYLEECINDIGNIVLPSSVLESDWIYEGRKEASGMHDTGLVGNATGSSLIREEFRRVCPERGPTDIVCAVREEDGNENANSKVLSTMGGIHFVAGVSRKSRGRHCIDDLHAAKVVQRIKAKNMPVVEIRNSFRRPTLSTKNDAPTAKTKL